MPGFFQGEGNKFWGLVGFFFFVGFCEEQTRGWKNW